MKNEINNKKGQLTIVRVFDAPLEKVWKAWTDLNMLEKWWGPKDFTAPHIELDFREGGKYLYCMKSPDGKEYWSTGVFKEIVPYEKIITTDSFADEKGNIVSAEYYGMKDLPLELEVAINFKKIDDMKTEMTLLHGQFPEKSMMEMTRQGWNQSFDKFAKILK